MHLRGILDVQRRGRWAVFSSVRRYEKGARFADQAQALPEVFRHCAADLLRRALLGALSPAAPPAWP
eukprot:9503012-Lingulodinium_polyedra.AAC.1